MDMTFLLMVAVVIAGLGTGIGFLLGRFVWPPAALVDQASLAAMQAEIARLRHECITLREASDALTSELKIAIGGASAAREESARLTERAASTAAQLTD
ncbi:MAG TPA: hypothetical protein VFC45_15185 [Pseudolabrys sp.]|nr:hypothetical protein [Pseudolabrys sp.]